MYKEIIIYSGIQPGKKGTGNFLSFFINKFHENNIKFKLISYNTPSGGLLVKIAKKIGVIKMLRSLYLNLIRVTSKDNISDFIVFIFHPQSIGLNITTNLIRNNKVYIYVLDTFFFCKKSYNYIDGNNACLKCISNPNASKENKCKFFLSNQRDEDYRSFQNAIQENLETICFLTQNDNQTLLLKEKFGNTINAVKLGMLINLDDDVPLINNNSLKYDFVFHNTNLRAKGVEYFINLAKNMPNYRFLIPNKINQIDKGIHSYQNIKNIDFNAMTWETGLKEAIINCKVVINPSLWSSPVEGALLKSIFFNGAVAVVDSDYSFQQEIPNNVVIKLAANVEQAKEKLLEVISSEDKINKLKVNSKKWFDDYQTSSNLLFDDFLSNEFIKNN